MDMFTSPRMAPNTYFFLLFAQAFVLAQASAGLAAAGPFMEQAGGAISTTAATAYAMLLEALKDLLPVLQSAWTAMLEKGQELYDTVLKSIQ